MKTKRYLLPLSLCLLIFLAACGGKPQLQPEQLTIPMPGPVGDPTGDIAVLQDGAVWLFAADESRVPQQLFSGEFSNLFWSPDGRTLLASFISGTELIAYNIESGNEKKIDFNIDNQFAEIDRTDLFSLDYLTWSPDSSQFVASMADGTGLSHIFTYNIATEQIILLRSFRGRPGDLFWQPDGERIYFAHAKQLVGVNPDGGQYRALYAPKEGEQILGIALY